MKKILLFLILFLVMVNLIAVFGPEIGFDALWYQLTLPKLWLLKRQWFFEGGLLYYSPMPRLGGVLFLPLMFLYEEAGAKLVQMSAGIITSWLIYKIARLKFDRELSLFAAAGFYISNIVSWQSGSAYVDLIRTMFEITGFYFSVSDKSKGLISSKKIMAGIMMGLAVGTKWQAIGTLLLMSLWFSPVIFIVGLLVSSPWMLIAYHFTNNPLYPIFETFMSQIQLKEVGAQYYDVKNVAWRILNVPWQFVRPYDDHTNPIYFGVVILIPFLIRKIRDKYDKSIFLFAVFGLLIWQVIPPPSTRYYLPYLPYLALLLPYLITRFGWLKYLLLISFVLVIGARIKANGKYLPYLIGKETKEQFLVKNIRRLPGTFVDEDKMIEKNFDSNKKYLVDGINNLYYFPFDFDHTSWAKDYDNYDYLVTTREPIWRSASLIYESSIGIKIYKKTLNK